MPFPRILFAVCAILSLCVSDAEVTEPSNCSPARNRIHSSPFSSVGKSPSSGRQPQAAHTHNVDSVRVVLLYNGAETELPVQLDDYDVALPEALGINVATVHLELRDKKNATHVLERTQSVAFWLLPQEFNAATWRPTSDDLDLMVKLSQHLKGQGQLHDAMQASRCAFEKAQTRTFQNVMARIEFICALAALSPAQQPHIKEALDLATQLQVQRARHYSRFRFIT
jgi:hypothetical protein